MQVLVTGGAGFIGANVTATLLEQPFVDRVTVIDDLSTGCEENLADVRGPSLTFVEGSILDRDLLAETLPGSDAVIHLAARPSVPRSIEDPVASHMANATGTVHLLEEVRRLEAIPHLIAASSSSVYGANKTMPKSEGLVTSPMSPYAVSKLATENYVLAYANCFDIPALVFRFFNVFGPLQPANHDYAAAIPVFVSHALKGEPIPVHGDGQQTRDFTFVGSVAQVITEAVRRSVTHAGPVNLAFGSRRSLLEVISEIQTVLDRPVEIKHTAPRPGDVRHSQADSQLLEELFPHVSRIDFHEGLRRTVAWTQDALEATEV